MLCTWVSHPEVTVDPTVRIQDWGLSPVGLARAARIATLFPPAPPHRQQQRAEGPGHRRDHRRTVGLGVRDR
ncbi:hypothetical protein [Curtobacterium sp. MCPF17_052]|uniref:hypothetical protein n=1 Tax=Curtobacterium sp. MCPF17_052 TaxID=2175655 RepID=UPI0024DFD074|nr:hypothetical protein [Curtobacterium sp. MCPF17_052]WIB13463.1 hypothetical protein DEJ36_06625 [Curtobacterium sp. MCPF17_052]